MCASGGTVHKLATVFSAVVCLCLHVHAYACQHMRLRARVHRHGAMLTVCLTAPSGTATHLYRDLVSNSEWEQEACAGHTTNGEQARHVNRLRHILVLPRHLQYTRGSNQGPCQPPVGT